MSGMSRLGTIQHLKQHTTLFTLLGLAFLFLPILFYAEPAMLSQIGSIFLVFCYFIALRDTLSREYLFPINSHTLTLLFLIIVSLLSWVLSRNIRSLYNLGLCIGGLYILYFFSDLTMDVKTIKRFFFISLAVLLVLVPLGVYMGFNGGISVFKGYESYFNRVIFKLMLPFSFFIVINIKRKYLVWVSLIVIYLFMVERTSAMAMSLILIMYYLLPLIKGTTNRIKWVFFIIIISLFLFNAIYVFLYQTEFGQELNRQIAEHTSKNLYSGRQKIWAVVIEQFQVKPIMGHGFDPDVLSRSDVSLSTHNAYLYILLHTGFSGLLLFIGYLYSFWKYLSENWSEASRLTLAYLTALLVFLNFELTLVANTMVLGLYYSLAIGVGVSLARQSRLLTHNEY